MGHGFIVPSRKESAIVKFMDDILKHVPSRLKDLRQSLDLSLDDIAQKSGVSRSMISQVERGKSAPTLVTLSKILTALETDLGAFLGTGAADASLRVKRRADTPELQHSGRGCAAHVFTPLESSSAVFAAMLVFSWSGSFHYPATDQILTARIFVVDGKLEIATGDTAEKLEAGDSATFKTLVDATITSRGNARAILMCS